MYLLIQEMPGNDLAASAGAEQDSLWLEWYETERRILRKTTENGRDISLRLFKEGQRLAHGDVVFADEKLLVRIAVRPCDVIVMSPKTLPGMARACYEIGNKHAPLFLEGEELLMPYDRPMFLWLEAAGFEPKQDRRRLSGALRANSAQGAGGHHHGHGHHEH